ncbi:hypothetical protein TNCV_2804411 [Trichonephila clavipes]|nr:hypothetical protein TNCV_2804411 [Trichonephila clavipes]
MGTFQIWIRIHDCTSRPRARNHDHSTTTASLTKVSVVAQWSRKKLRVIHGRSGSNLITVNESSKLRYLSVSRPDPAFHRPSAYGCHQRVNGFRR